MAKSKYKIVLYCANEDLYIETFDYRGFYLTDMEGALNLIYIGFFLAKLLSKVISKKFNVKIIAKKILEIKNINMESKG